MFEPQDNLVLDRAGSRELDRLAVVEYGLPTLVLMENAAHALALRAMALAGTQQPGVLIVCGSGNNGGDGLASARHLHNRGARVAIAQPLGRAQSPDARVHERVVKAMGLPVFDTIGAAAAALGTARLVIDALLGTGLDRDLSQPALEAVRAINGLGAAGTLVLSADCPSGMDVDTGRPRPEAVRAAETLTFASTKAGFSAPEAQAYVGNVRVADIGVPRELVARLARARRDA